MVSSEKFRSLPVWLLGGLIVIAVLSIAFTLWRDFAGGATAPAPADKAVHPGMYDFRKEAENGNLGRRVEAH